LQGRKTQNSYTIAKFYDKQKNYKAAYVYYNEVIQQQPDSPDAEKAKLRMDQIRAKVGDQALQIGAKDTAQGISDRRKLQAVADTAGRPDFVGPPPPTPSPTPAPAATPLLEQPAPEQKPMRTAPTDVTPAPVQPAPVEPALPSQ
jgi:outer membrane protein assembly factor BamD